jgi:hypothetical protein
MFDQLFVRSEALTRQLSPFERHNRNYTGCIPEIADRRRQFLHDPLGFTPCLIPVFAGLPGDFELD